MAADGGGLTAPVLTADLAARAIIAAAASLGVDPVKAVGGGIGGNHARLAVTAAGGGLRKGADMPFDVLERVLGVKRQTMNVARCKIGDRFKAAEQAAMRAVEFALWRPDAAESVAAPELHEEIEVETAPDLVRVEVIEPGPRMSPAGPIATAVRPPPPMQRTPAQLAHAERSIADLVLEALKVGPMTSMSLASCIDRKEMAVCGALSALDHQGLVISRPLESGPRRLEWSLSPEGDPR